MIPTEIRRLCRYLHPVPSLGNFPDAPTGLLAPKFFGPCVGLVFFGLAIAWTLTLGPFSLVISVISEKKPAKTTVERTRHQV